MAASHWKGDWATAAQDVAAAAGELFVLRTAGLAVAAVYVLKMTAKEALELEALLDSHEAMRWQCWIHQATQKRPKTQGSDRMNVTPE